MENYKTLRHCLSQTMLHPNHPAVLKYHQLVGAEVTRRLENWFQVFQQLRVRTALHLETVLRCLIVEEAGFEIDIIEENLDMYPLHHKSVFVVGDSSGKSYKVIYLIRSDLLVIFKYQELTSMPLVAETEVTQ